LLSGEIKAKFWKKLYQTAGVMFICNLQTKLLQADTLTDAWYKHLVDVPFEDKWYLV
jgi:hypothetical protein